MPLTSTILTTLTPAASALLAAAFGAAAALWAGTLFSVSWLSGRARLMADGPEVGRLALTLFRRWTTPSLLASLAAGVGWGAVTPLGRLTIPAFAGLVAAVFVLALLHGTVGARAGRVVNGSIRATSGEGFRRFALVVTFGAVFALASMRGLWMP